jgi:two-component system sensor histidine kinase UhpB
VAIGNAAVLAAACVITALVFAPYAQNVALRELLIFSGGLVLMLAINLLLLRRALGPLRELTAFARRIDPLEPGLRLQVTGGDSEASELADAFNDMLDRVERERRESAHRQLAAQQEERRRISRELHDEIGQSLTALSLHLARISGAPEAERDEELVVAEETAFRLIEDVRTLAQSLRPDVLDNLGLTSALANLLERLSAQTGLQVRWQLAKDLPPLGDNTELVLYRVAQEALNNVVRHANARQVELTLAREDGLVCLSVTDDGDGIPPTQLDAGPAGLGSGIRFMRERALLVGARVTVRAGAGGGTEVSLKVPLEGERPVGE